MTFFNFVTFTFWNYYVLKLLHLETITFSDATLSDINIVWCYVLSQYRKWCCDSGHRGWGCNDPELAVPDFTLLVSTLLLTLTNMATLPAVVLALFRHYTTTQQQRYTKIKAKIIHSVVIGCSLVGPCYVRFLVKQSRFFSFCFCISLLPLFRGTK